MAQITKIESVTHQLPIPQLNCATCGKVKEYFKPERLVFVHSLTCTSNPKCWNSSCEVIGTEKTPLNKCGGCAVARYCSTKCQRQNWKGQHQLECKSFKSKSEAGQLNPIFIARAGQKFERGIVSVWEEILKSREYINTTSEIKTSHAKIDEVKTERAKVIAKFLSYSMQDLIPYEFNFSSAYTPSFQVIFEVRVQFKENEMVKLKISELKLNLKLMQTTLQHIPLWIDQVEGTLDRVRADEVETWKERIVAARNLLSKTIELSNKYEKKIEEYIHFLTNKSSVYKSLIANGQIYPDQAFEEKVYSEIKGKTMGSMNEKQVVLETQALSIFNEFLSISGMEPEDRGSAMQIKKFQKKIDKFGNAHKK